MILKSIILVACHGCVVGALQIGMQLPHHPRAHVNFRSVMKRSASSSPLFTTPSNSNDTNGSAATSLALPDTSTIAPWAKTAAIFALGYSLGATVIRRESQKAVSTKFGFIHMSLAVLVVRDLWRSTPKWAKPRITKFARKVTGWFGLHSGAINAQEEEENEDMDDISNFANFATKLRVMVRDNMMHNIFHSCH